MTILNTSINSIPDSPTLKIGEQAALLKSHGKNVLNLSLGEPDTEIPLWVRQAAVEAINRGDHFYTPTAGTPALKAAILQKIATENNLSSFEPHNVLISTGAKQVLYNALTVSLEKGDEVIIPAPYWVSYPAIVALAGGTSVVVPCSEETGFKLTPEALEKAITSKSRWCILNSPNNPSGAVYTASELRALSTVLEKHPSLWIISDEIYEHLVYSGHAHTSLLEIAPHLASRTLLVNGVSKSFAMTGWRLGYGVGPAELITGMGRLQSQSTSGTCCITQSAAIAALSDPRGAQFLDHQRHVFQRRRDIFVEALARVPGVRLNHPGGAFYVFVDCRELLFRHTTAGRFVGCDTDLAQALLEEALISAVPGTEFGVPGYLRFSYTMDDAVLLQAAERLHRWVAS